MITFTSSRFLRRCSVVTLLLILLVGSARAAESVQAAEQHIATGLALQQAGKSIEAAKALETGLEGLEDLDRQAAVHRTLGHWYVAQARDQDEVERRQALIDRAASHYRAAGEAGDLAARRHYLSVECSRSPERGYAAGWQFVSWNGMLAIDGWLAVIGNYGAAMTGAKASRV